MTRILIEKSARVLTLTDERGEARFPIALGRVPEGAKRQEGDGRTPEGEYFICSRNPRSKYTLSLGVSYPNAEDAYRAYERGEITRAQLEAIVSTDEARMRPPWDTKLGGWIMIHGGGIDGDWTEGCVALSDADMQRIWERTKLGDPIRIIP